MRVSIGSDASSSVRGAGFSVLIYYLEGLPIPLRIAVINYKGIPVRVGVEPNSLISRFLRVVCDLSRGRRAVGGSSGCYNVSVLDLFSSVLV